MPVRTLSRACILYANESSAPAALSVSFEPALLAYQHGALSGGDGLAENRLCVPEPQPVYPAMS